MIRHGQTDWNLGNRIQGNVDTPLNLNGISQAKDVAMYLKSGNFGIKRIVSSDLRRAGQTAKIIGNRLKVNVEYDPRLREYDFGQQLEGKSAVGLSRVTLANFLQNPESVGAESFEDAFARMSNFLAAIDYDTNILVVSHGGIMRFALHYFNDGHVFDLQKFLNVLHNAHMENTSVFRVASPNSIMERVR